MILLLNIGTGIDTSKEMINSGKKVINKNNKFYFELMLKHYIPRMKNFDVLYLVCLHYMKCPLQAQIQMLLNNGNQDS